MKPNSDSWLMVAPSAAIKTKELAKAVAMPTTTHAATRASSVTARTARISRNPATALPTSRSIRPASSSASLRHSIMRTVSG